MSQWGQVEAEAEVGVEEALSRKAAIKFNGPKMAEPEPETEPIQPEQLAKAGRTLFTMVAVLCSSTQRAARLKTNKIMLMRIQTERTT